MPADDTPSGSSEPGLWILPDSLRPAFQRPYGPVYQGGEFTERLRTLSVFATCGDRVTADALALGVYPIVGIVDYKTQRRDPVDPSAFAGLALRRRVAVKNPPGTISSGLRWAVRDLLHAGGGLVEVEGEEDLGVMVLVEFLPLGATVLYGVPGVGVCFLSVDLAAKSRVQELFQAMVWQPEPRPP
jgi:GTP-dependent dephospho-CoA kinase